MDSQDEVLRFLLDALEELEIPYAIAGSVAAMAYGEPRATRDIDVVVELHRRDIPRLQSRFPNADFYLSPEAAAEAIDEGGSFNIIHPESGFKIDLFVAHDDDQRGEIARARDLPALPGRSGRFAAPEDLILSKLRYYRMGESEKHLRDIAAMLQVSGDEIDRERITREADRLGLSELWDAVLRRVEEAGG